MSKTFDLSTLNLSAGTHKITVKARASGYMDSPASDPVDYVVAGDTPDTPTEETYTVSGTWYFNEKVSLTSETVTTDVNFYSGDYSYVRILVGTFGVRYNTKMVSTVAYDTSLGGGAWKYEAKRTITFDGVQNVSKEFKEWLEANAVFAFTIDGTTYYAKSGMTWDEWVNSDYNTGGFVDGGDCIKYSESSGIVVGFKNANGFGEEVLPSDIIKQVEYNYQIRDSGGSN